MSNRIAVFNDGVIQQLADPITLYEQPENAFVAQFIGENNRLNGVIDSISKGVAKVKLENGSVVEALDIKSGGRGKKTMLSIRPERCILAKSRSRLKNMMQGKIEELIYLGDHVRCRMNVAGDDQFIVKVPNNEGQIELAVGNNIFVGWNGNDCRALDYNSSIDGYEKVKPYL